MKVRLSLFTTMIFLFGAAAFLLLFVSCSKDNAPSNQEKLIGKQWWVRYATVNGAVRPEIVTYGTNFRFDKEIMLTSTFSPAYVDQQYYRFTSADQVDLTAVYDSSFTGTFRINYLTDTVFHFTMTTQSNAAVAYYECIGYR